MEWHLTLEDETHSDVEMGPARPIHPMRPNMFQGGMGHMLGLFHRTLSHYPSLVAVPFEDKTRSILHVSCLCEFARVVHFILTLKHFDLNI